MTRHRWGPEPLIGGAQTCVRCGAERGFVNRNAVYRPKDGKWGYSYVPCRPVAP